MQHNLKPISSTSVSCNMRLQFCDCRLRLKCDGARAETRFRLSEERTSPFKSAGASVQSATGSRGVRISGSNAGYTMFRGSVKGTGYPLHSPVSPSLPLPCITMCHHVSTNSTTLMPVMKQRFIYQLPNSYCSITFTILHTASWYILQPPQCAEILVADRCPQIMFYL